jgi:hypothetical protein
MMWSQPNHEHRWSPRQVAETGLRVYSRGQRPWAGRWVHAVVAGAPPWLAGLLAESVVGGAGGQPVY